jgi:hypothetical protein
MILNKFQTTLFLSPLLMEAAVTVSTDQTEKHVYYCPFYSLIQEFWNIGIAIIGMAVVPREKGL